MKYYRYSSLTENKPNLFAFIGSSPNLVTAEGANSHYY